MSFDPEGDHRGSPITERLNVYALVIYIPDPLGRFLDDLRRELVPDYNPHAHVSVLPPRPLCVDWRVGLRGGPGVRGVWGAFWGGMASIGGFPVSDGVYLGVGGRGFERGRLYGAR